MEAGQQPLVKERPKPAHASLQPLKLIYGDWKDSFTELRRKLIIAETLNECVQHDKLVICGYLITHKTVYLLLYIEPAHLNKMLQLFYEKVRKEVRSRQESISLLEEPIAKLEIASSTKLFVRLPLHDLPLIGMMTGKPTDFLYYNPQTERLKDQIHHYGFCSAMDYSGAKGPVIISKKYTNDEHLKNLNDESDENTTTF